MVLVRGDSGTGNHSHLLDLFTLARYFQLSYKASTARGTSRYTIIIMADLIVAPNLQELFPHLRPTLRQIFYTSVRPFRVFNNEASIIINLQHPQAEPILQFIADILEVYAIHFYTPCRCTKPERRRLAMTREGYEVQEDGEVTWSMVVVYQW